MRTQHKMISSLSHRLKEDRLDRMKIVRECTIPIILQLEKI